jgi:hypothetical protein
MIYGMVPIQDISKEWPEALPWIEAACDYNNNRYKAQDHLEQILKNNSQLWLVKDPHIIGVIITSLVPFPQKLCCTITICTGERGGEWIRNVSFIESWAKAQGCQQMLLPARLGMSKILKDYRKTHIILEKDL